jgi:hypothetical protein
MLWLPSLCEAAGGVCGFKCQRTVVVFSIFFQCLLMLRQVVHPAWQAVAWCSRCPLHGTPTVVVWRSRRLCC